MQVEPGWWSSSFLPSFTSTMQGLRWVQYKFISLSYIWIICGVERGEDYERSSVAEVVTLESAGLSVDNPASTRLVQAALNAGKPIFYSPWHMPRSLIYSPPSPPSNLYCSNPPTPHLAHPTPSSSISNLFCYYRIWDWELLAIISQDHHHQQLHLMHFALTLTFTPAAAKGTPDTRVIGNAKFTFTHNTCIPSCCCCICNCNMR